MSRYAVTDIAPWRLLSRALVGTEDQRHVAEGGQAGAERLVEQDLSRRVGEVIVAADHVRDPHLDVVDHDAEVVGRRAVGAEQDQVVELGRSGRRRGPSRDRRSRSRLPRVREAHDVTAASPARGAQVAAACRRRWACAPRRARPCASASRLLGRAVAAVGLALAQQALDLRRRYAAVRLLWKNGPSSQPISSQRRLVEDRVDRRVGRALAVGVLDAQHEGAAVMAREEEVEERRARAADVQVAGRARSEARSKMGRLRHCVNFFARCLTCRMAAADPENRRARWILAALTGAASAVYSLYSPSRLAA